MGRLVAVMTAGILLLGSLFATTALAQVNAEPLRREPITPGWGGTLEGSFALSRGNVEVLDVGGLGRIQQQSLYPQPKLPDGTVDDRLPPYVKQRFLFVGNGRFSERPHEVFTNQAFAHFRWTRMWLPRVGTDAVLQYQFNQFLRLQVRALVAGGIRVEAVHRRAINLVLSATYMFEYEHIRVEEGASDAPVARNNRLGLSAVLRGHFSERVFYQNALFLQPRLDNFRDFRLLNESEVAVAVNSTVALGLTVAVLHDSQPPTGVKPTDLRLLNTVKLSF